MGSKGIIGRIADRLAREAAHVRLFGAGAAKHGICGLMGKRECTLSLGGVGQVAVRLDQPDLASFRRIFGEGEYDLRNDAVESAIGQSYDAILESGSTPVIVDAGAYVGASSLWFASRYPDAHVVAIEPHEDSARLLERNLASLERSTTIRAAVGATPGHVKLVSASELWAAQVQRSGDGVPVITMNEAFATVSDGVPFLAKINIEGFEEDLFSDNLQWLDRVTVLLIEPHDWLFPGRHTSRTFQKALGARDFHLFVIEPHLCYVRL